MKVTEVMTREVHMARPEDSLAGIARTLAEHDLGFVPVQDGDRMIGIVTDRDIVVRGVAKGLGSDAMAREVMSDSVMYCFDDDEVDAVIKNMADIQVRRLPVVDRDKRLVGIVSLADMARKHDAAHSGAGLKGIVAPGGSHNQAAAHH